MSVYVFQEQPSILCKYRDWSNLSHRTVLTKRELYYAPPSSFEDLTDCRNDLDEFSEYERQVNFNELDKRCGILSMTKEQDNNFLWDKYANHSRGFMVAFDGRMLCDLSSASGDVEYYDVLPKVKSIKEQTTEEYIFKKYYAKLNQYNFEHEFRLININPIELPKEQRKVLIPVEAYKYIKIGRNMSDIDKSELVRSLPVELRNLPILHQSSCNP